MIGHLESAATAPLAKFRVLDCTHAWAGPMASQMAAYFGAQVIHIEAPHRPDRWRGPIDPSPDYRITYRYPDGEPGSRPYDRSAFFNERNTGKLGLALDLTHPRGREIFSKLALISDAVVTNYSTRALQKLRLDHASLTKIRPDIISLSITGMGETGPEHDYLAWGVTIEAMSGLSSQKGYRHGPPCLSNMAYADPIGGIYAGAALLTALWHRQRTGEGQHIDLSLLECCTELLIDAIVEYSITGHERSRIGNRHPNYAPRGCYPCLGEDKWIAIAVTSEKEWDSLRSVVGNPEWVQDERFASRDGRKANQDELDERLAGWTARQDRDELMKSLQGAHVPAGAVLSNVELADDAHLRARGYFTELHHCQAGKHSYPGLPFALSGTPGSHRLPAPAFGEHNRFILCDLLGLSSEEYLSLVDDEVIADRPLRPK